MKNCPKCGKQHEKSGTYCSHSCANSRKHSVETKQNISIALSGKKRPNVPLGGCFKRHDDVKHICSICGKQSIVRYSDRNKKTCGAEDCITFAKVGKRTYINGTRNPTWFFNPFENKEVLLESSWEVEIANFLIQNNIKWIRPKFIKWIDSLGKTRRYFPDFYLPDYDLYLDPKNPYCMKRDKEKIEIISSKVSLIVGDINTIKEQTLCKIT